ncbi:MAG: glycosyltransferase [Mucilaginibacter sp.]|uniref:glycosyltransferase n=1 Tax=Mucilaginibacter sp. TaxID=1882438 RepID=UPI003264AFD1
MRIGIIEVCEPNHYTAVEALAKTYTTHPDNEVIIYTLKSIAPLFKDLTTQIVVKSENETLADFLAGLASFNLDRIHINTISKFYKEFAQVKWSAPVYLTVHNIDLFFANSFATRTRRLFYELGIKLSGKSKQVWSAPLIQYLKDFKRQRYRNIISKQVHQKDSRVIVYGHAQKEYLKQMFDAKKIIVFPFGINEGLADLSDVNTKLRICIPGSVSSKRRNYDAVFKLLKRYPEIKNNIILDILGYIPETDRYLVPIMDELIKTGAEVIYNLDFVDTADFNDRLSKADMILGNIKIQLDPFQKYGITKETGTIFNIIRSGKPGMLPADYPVDAELKDICLSFENYGVLAGLLKQLINDRSQLKRLKQLAAQKVKYYRPESLYKTLVN